MASGGVTVSTGATVSVGVEGSFEDGTEWHDGIIITAIIPKKKNRFITNMI